MNIDKINNYNAVEFIHGDSARTGYSKYLLEESFFDNLVNNINFKGNNIIIVCHAIKSLIPFITVLKKYNKINKILIKPKSINKEIIGNLDKSEYDFEILDRANHSEKDKLISKIDQFSNGDACIIFDIGGYFSSIFDDDSIVKSIIGIVEDTENGQQKYENKDLYPINLKMQA